MRSSYLIAGAAMLLASVGLARPSAQAPQKTMPAASAASTTGALGGNAEHGKYLVEGIAQCVQCHSPRDEAGDIIVSQEFHGAPVPVRPPWADNSNWALIAPRNAGLPGYDDQQALRLLMEGAIDRNGKQLRSPMPRFHMSRQDAADVIAYMRSRQ
jgi:mono/diheme cytochrome c family protein